MKHRIIEKLFLWGDRIGSYLDRTAITFEEQQKVNQMKKESAQLQRRYRIQQGKKRWANDQR